MHIEELIQRMNDSGLFKGVFTCEHSVLLDELKVIYIDYHVLGSDYRIVVDYKMFTEQNMTTVAEIIKTVAEINLDFINLYNEYMYERGVN